MNSLILGSNALNNSAHHRIRGIYLAEKADFAIPADLSNGNGVLAFCDVDSNKRFL